MLSNLLFRTYKSPIMKINYVLLLSFLFFITIFESHAQKMKNTTKADFAFDNGDYSKAFEKYTKVFPKLKNKEQKAEVAFRLGECARYMHDLRKSRTYYKRAVKLKYADPIAVLRYAEALKMLEDYEEAAIQYKEYASLVPDDYRGKLGEKSCKLSTQWQKTPTRHIVKPIRSINSKQMDFCPAIVDESKIYFTSTREGALGNKPNVNTGQSFSDIWVAKIDRKGDWSTPVQIQGQVNSPNGEGAICFTKDKKTMYLTFVEGGKKAFGVGQIFISKKGGDGWGKPGLVKLVEDSSVNVSNPAISPDELTLYFVSDLPGGEGGKDIWYVERKNKSGNWGKPINAGKEINTAGDERFPFVRDDGTLYFASDGHPSMGGLDIFKAEKNEDKKWVVENLKSPINSAADDFGIVFHEKSTSGYFSSNRKEENTRGADDIFSFELPKMEFALKARVEDSQNGMPLPGAKIQLYGSDGTLVEAESDASGEANFKLKENTDYRAVAVREKYLKGKAKETTRGLTENKTLQILIPMDPMGINIEVENIFYDLNKANLRPESFVELDKLVEKLLDNPEALIELSAHTDFRGSEEDNRDLSQRRARAVVDYLITKNIAPERLKAIGLGESKPKTVTKKMAKKYNFLNEGDVLSEDFINRIKDDEQKEICHQINRRTEFLVIAPDQKDTFFFGDDKKTKKDK